MIKAVIFDLDGVIAISNQGFSDSLGMSQTAYAANEMGLSEIFDEIFSSSGVGYLKKEPEFWQFVLKRVSAAPEEILYWDDSEDYVKAAGSAGIQAELYTDFDSFQRRLSSVLEE